MITYLKGQAQKIKSKNLSNLMVKMTEDHFVKVRGMIKDMIAKLEADAAARSSFLNTVIVGIIYGGFVSAVASAAPLRCSAVPLRCLCGCLCC